MKTAIIIFRNPDEEFDSEYLKNITEIFTARGVSIDCLELLSIKDEIRFRHSLERFADTVDNLIILDNEENTFSVKDVVVEKTDSTLAENENALTFLQAVSTADGIDYSKDYAFLPIEATLIPNINGAYQGYMLDDKEFTLVVLPAGEKQFRIMCDKYVLPYVENKMGVKHKRDTFKYFGSKIKLEKILKTAEENSDNNLRCLVKEDCGDFTINLNYRGEDLTLYNQLVRYVYEELKEGLYADYDATLSQCVFDLLKINNLKLSVAESFTAGRLVSSIISNSGASQYVDEGIVSYSNQSKIDRLGVGEADLKARGAVSSIVAYQMVVGLLSKGICDIAVSTTGIAGPKSDDTDKPVGLAYIGIGMKDGVHTYKLKLSGNREQITETAKNTALFLIIKKLKNL